MVKQMADKPLVMALANPTPEIMPDEARKARPDAMICTGRSDFPNQVNNVLCFPFIFRGALDVGATAINEEMKHAAVDAIAQLARDPPSDVGRARLRRRRDAGVRPRFADPEPVRSASDPAHRAGGGEGGDGFRRGDAADHEFRRLYRRSWSASRSAPASS